MIRKVFQEVVGHTFPPFRRMQYTEAMRDYGIDKPDLRYDMKLKYLTGEWGKEEVSETSAFRSALS